jgi:hypothetical protein
MKAIAASLLLVTVAVPPTAAQAGRFDVRFGGAGLVLKRRAVFAQSPGSESGVLGCVTGSARTRYGGLSMRIWGGRFRGDSGAPAAGKVASGDVSLLVGVPTISLEAGYARRGLTGAAGTITWSFTRLGVRIEVPVGSSGVAVGFSASEYLGIKQRRGPGTGSGREGETSVIFLPARLPVYLKVGYGMQRFTARSAAGDVPEDVSGIMIGGGLRFRSARRP